VSELPRITSLVIAWLSMQVVVDTFITSTLVHSNLQRECTDSQSPATLVIVFSRSRTGFRKTDTILNRLIRGAIQTGLLSVIFSAGDLITFVVFPNTTIYVMLAIPVGRIYSNVSVINVTKVYRPLI
jgi:hypothetical protein